MIAFIKSLFGRQSLDKLKELENERDILIIDIKNIIQNKTKMQELLCQQSDELNERAKQAVRVKNTILAKHYIQLRQIKLKNLQQISNEILQLNTWYDQMVQAARMSKHIKQMKQVNNYIKSVDLVKLQEEYQEEIAVFKQQKDMINQINDQIEYYNQEDVNSSDIQTDMKLLEDEIAAEAGAQIPSPLKLMQTQQQKQKVVL